MRLQIYEDVLVLMEKFGRDYWAYFAEVDKNPALEKEDKYFMMRKETQAVLDILYGFDMADLEPDQRERAKAVFDNMVDLMAKYSKIHLYSGPKF